MQCFPREVECIILSHLFLDEILRYWKCINGVWSYPRELNTEFSRRLLARLAEEFDIDQKGIAAWRKEPRGDVVLTGSFILETLFGEQWDGVDLDFFIHKNILSTDPNIHHMLAAAEDGKRTLNRLPAGCDFLNYLWRLADKEYAGVDISNYGNIPGSGVTFGRGYRIKDKIIQLIVIGDGGCEECKQNGFLDQKNRYFLGCKPVICQHKSSSWHANTIRDYIQDHCDFNFLKNTFDGYELKLGNMESIGLRSSIHCYKRDGDEFIVECICPSNGIGTIQPIAIRYRCQKYLSRGFKITNYCPVPQHVLGSDCIPINKCSSCHRFSIQASSKVSDTLPVKLIFN
jgi:hypothetical protein